jgi:hypothetical protein
MRYYNVHALQAIAVLRHASGVDSGEPTPVTVNAHSLKVSLTQLRLSPRYEALRKSIL